MEFELVKILSGAKANIFTVKLAGDKYTLFEKFIIENKTKYSDELEDINHRILVMARKKGAREQFFKINEGNPGDGVCALYDMPEKNLRLYCVRYGGVAVILGGGGEKPEGMIALQESVKLTEENYLMRDVSSSIMAALNEKRITWSDDGIDLISDENPIILQI